MSTKTFFIQLLSVAGVLAALLFALNFVEEFYRHQSLYWMSWGFFVGLSILMYYIALGAAKSKNPHTFHQMAILFIFGKMLLTVVIIIAYLQIAKPETTLFIIPFFIIYFGFSIFEYYFMIKLGKTNPDTKKKL